MLPTPRRDDGIHCLVSPWTASTELLQVGRRSTADVRDQRLTTDPRRRRHRVAAIGDPSQRNGQYGMSTAEEAQRTTTTRTSSTRRAPRARRRARAGLAHPGLPRIKAKPPEPPASARTSQRSRWCSGLGLPAGHGRTGSAATDRRPAMTMAMTGCASAFQFERFLCCPRRTTTPRTAAGIDEARCQGARRTRVGTQCSRRRPAA